MSRSCLHEQENQDDKLKFMEVKQYDREESISHM